MKVVKITLATISLSLAITATVGAVIGLLAGGYEKIIFVVAFFGPVTALLYGIYLTLELKEQRGRNVFFWLTLIPMVAWFVPANTSLLYK